MLFRCVVNMYAVKKKRMREGAWLTYIASPLGKNVLETLEDDSDVGGGDEHRQLSRFCASRPGGTLVQRS